MSLFRVADVDPREIEVMLPSKNKITDSWAENFPDNNLIYTKMRIKGINETLENLKKSQNEISTISNAFRTLIFDNLTENRKEIANTLTFIEIEDRRYSKHDLFITPVLATSDDDFHSELVSRFRSLYFAANSSMTAAEKVREKREEWVQVKLDEESSLSTSKYYHHGIPIAFHDSGIILTSLTFKLLDGEEIPYEPEDSESEDSESEDSESEDSEFRYQAGDLEITHTPKDQIDKIFEKVEELFLTLATHLEPSDENIERIASIVWWLSHAMPLTRGSASVIESCNFLLQKWVGLEPIRYQGNIHLDLVALFSTRKNFVDEYKKKLYPNLRKNEGNVPSA